MSTVIESKAFFAFDVKAVDAGQRTFSGLASTWELDLQDDVIERGAFADTLRDWKKTGRTIPLLDSHDIYSIRSAIGKLDAAEERESGLWTRWQVVSGADGDAVLARIADGIVDGLSIGYRPSKWSHDAVSGVRTLKEVELKEVSLVLFPANVGARVGRKGFNLPAPAGLPPLIQQLIDDHTRERRMQLATNRLTPELQRRLADIRTVAPKKLRTIGEAFVESDEFKRYAHAVEARYPFSGPIGLDYKTVPVITQGVIPPDYDVDAVLVPFPPQAVIRNLVNVRPTTSNLITYPVISFMPAPIVVPEGEPKPEQAGGDWDMAAAPVLTLAYWVPASVELLEDPGVFADTIDDVLIGGLAQVEERQCLWGDSDTGGFSGLLDDDTAVPVIPTPADSRDVSTLAKAVLAGLSDVASRGGTPDAVLCHPTDWEILANSMLDESGFLNGQAAIWGARLYPTNQMADAAGNRWLLVGDWARGATLYDRRTARVEIGLQADQFIRNMRSILCEERVAWAVKRPHFFAKYQTFTVTP